MFEEVIIERKIPFFDPFKHAYVKREESRASIHLKGRQSRKDMKEEARKVEGMKSVITPQSQRMKTGSSPRNKKELRHSGRIRSLTLWRDLYYYIHHSPALRYFNVVKEFY